MNTDRIPDAPVTPVAEPPAQPGAGPNTDVPDAPNQAEESTVGTGTSMALGCIAGTVVLIAFGLLFLLVSQLV